MTEESNPFSAPKSNVIVEELNDEFELAERKQRLFAFLIEMLLLIAIALPFIISIFASLYSPERKLFIFSASIITFILFIFYSAINIYFLVKNGQTMGKKIIKIRIANEFGENPGFWYIFGLRIFVPNLLSGIPFLGPIFQIANILFIFREDRKCIHDIIARTQVIKC